MEGPVAGEANDVVMSEWKEGRLPMPEANLAKTEYVLTSSRPLES